MQVNIKTSGYRWVRAGFTRGMRRLLQREEFLHPFAGEHCHPRGSLLDDGTKQDLERHETRHGLYFHGGVLLTEWPFSFCTTLKNFPGRTMQAAKNSIFKRKRNKAMAEMQCQHSQSKHAQTKPCFSLLEGSVRIGHAMSGNSSSQQPQLARSGRHASHAYPSAFSPLFFQVGPPGQQTTAIVRLVQADSSVVVVALIASFVPSRSPASISEVSEARGRERGRERGAEQARVANATLLPPAL